MIKTYFNQLMSYDEIVNAYVNKQFPNAECLLFDKKSESIKLLATEHEQIVNDEMERSLAIDGSSRINL